MGADATIDWRAAAASAASWWLDAGVDVQIAEEARDWLAKPATPVPNAPTNKRDAVAPAAPVPAALPPTLEALLAWRAGPDAPEAGWPGAPLITSGDPAPLLVLVDLPDREDVAEGLLLAGAPGRLFDRMLAAIGETRSSVYLVALAARRPPAGRIAPEVEAQLAEVARHHVALAAPKRVLALGNAASRAITGADVAPARGTLYPVNLIAGTTTMTIEAVASFHPRFLVERPVCKAEAWRDLQMLIGGFGR